MATNKRKDSAALFELIDKSTLKVPKQAGSLKIPAWWSSKSNPPTTTVNGAGVPISRPVTGGLVNGVQAAKQEEAAGETPRDSADSAQTRLFDPPAVDAVVEASPSFRPPAPATGSRFGPAEVPHSNGNGSGHTNGNGHVNGGPVAETVELAEHDLPLDTPEVVAEAHTEHGQQDGYEQPEGYSGSGSGRRVFAPQTMSQNAGFVGDWATSNKFRLARLPMWVMVAGACGVVVTFLLIVYLLMSLHGGPKPVAIPSAARVGGGGPAGGSLPGNGIGQGRPLLPQRVQGNGGGNLQLPPRPLASERGNGGSLQENAAPAKVFEPGTVQRSGELYYIIVATTPTEWIARRNGDLIAKNGVDVSIETQMSKTNKLLYKLISVKGYSSISEAGPARKRIVEIGHLLPDFAKTRKAWDDATVMRWSSLVGSASRN